MDIFHGELLAVGFSYGIIYGCGIGSEEKILYGKNFQGVKFPGEFSRARMWDYFCLSYFLFGWSILYVEIILGELSL